MKRSLFILRLYAALSVVFWPFLRGYLKYRQGRGKEDKHRISERRGIASQPRPAGHLVWLHASSNGEAMSTLSLINNLLACDPDCHILITTGTVTSALLLSDRLPARVIHQYAPLDHLFWVRRFLKHWRPNSAVWIESELWPCLIQETRKRGCAMVLVNARMSSRSFLRWQNMRIIVRELLPAFSCILCQTKREAERLSFLAGKNTRFLGNLKGAAPPLPDNDRELSRLRQETGTRPLWVFASTYPGEEAMALHCHRQLRKKIPALLTVIVPRHPLRGDSIMAEFLKYDDIEVLQRSRGDLIHASSDIYLGDTTGELGIFYRLCSLAVIGGSFSKDIGGHNPMEAAQLGVATIFGPDMENFEDLAAGLLKSGGACQVSSTEGLLALLERLFNNDNALGQMQAAALEESTRHMDAAIHIMETLKHILLANTALCDGKNPGSKNSKEDSGDQEGRTHSHASP